MIWTNQEVVVVVILAVVFTLCIFSCGCYWGQRRNELLNRRILAEWVAGAMIANMAGNRLESVAPVYAGSA